MSREAVATLASTTFQLLDKSGGRGDEHGGRRVLGRVREVVESRWGGRTRVAEVRSHPPKTLPGRRWLKRRAPPVCC